MADLGGGVLNAPTATLGEYAHVSPSGVNFGGTLGLQTTPNLGEYAYTLVTGFNFSGAFPDLSGTLLGAYTYTPIAGFNFDGLLGLSNIVGLGLYAYVSPTGTNLLGAFEAQGVLGLGLYAFTPSPSIDLGGGFIESQVVARLGLYIGRTVFLAGIPTQEAFGLTALGTQVIESIGILSEEAFGALLVELGAPPQLIEPLGITTEEAFGALLVELGAPPQTISTIAFVSVGAFGDAQIIRTTTFPSIPSQELFGRPGISSAPTPAPPQPVNTRHVYRLVVVDKNGNAVTELENALVTEIGWALNEPGFIRFSLPTTDAKAAFLRTPFQEVQVYRDGQLLQWAILAKPSANAKTLNFECPGLMWYFTRRFFGRADRANLVSNGDFEGNLGGWEAIGVHAEVSSEQHITGAFSAKLTQANANTDTYLRYRLEDYAPGGVGAFLTIVAWAFLPSGGFVGPAYGGRGLWAARYNQGGTELQTDEWPLDAEDTDVWTRMEIGLNVEPNAVEDIEIRLYAPGGVVYWDSINVVLMESTSSIESISDLMMEQANIVKMIVEHAQDVAFQKSWLNIGTYCPTTGIERERHFQHAEHGNIYDAGLRPFTELEDGMDMDIALTPTTRTFRTHYPRQGGYRSDLTLEWGKNISDFSFSFDGQQAANSIVVLAQNTDGPDREEGGAVDSSRFGGLTLEAIETATIETPIDALDGKAREALARFSNSYVLELDCHDHAERLVGNLAIGDIVRVRINHGYVQVDSDWRVIAMRFSPVKEMTHLELNPA